MPNRDSIGYSAVVPANSTRYFDSFETAVGQPSAELDLVWDSESRTCKNRRFDETLIRWDGSYCTSQIASQGQATLATLQYFETSIAPWITTEENIVDIGCGQGEFVEAVRSLGFEAVGFDPALKHETDNLRARLWSPEERFPAALFVMRCVLPHIENWEGFLEALFNEHPNSMVLIEFQSLGWTITNGIWQQLCHDHVNIFTRESFSVKYSVLVSGTFAQGEWEYVLIGRAPREPSPIDTHAPKGFGELLQQRSACITSVQETGRSIAVWGAAGKGGVFCHAVGSTRDIFAIDADSARWGKYLEASGVKVMSPGEAMAMLSRGSLILVSNPGHLDEVVKFVGSESHVLPIDKHLPDQLRKISKG